MLPYPSAHGEASGNYSLEADIFFLFPDVSGDEYGVFLGGQDVEGAATPGDVGCLLRADGHAAILLKEEGGDAVKNTIRVDVDPTSVTMRVNGTKVHSVPRETTGSDGRMGFRVGKAVNLHISTLNVTRRLAPVPFKKEMAAPLPTPEVQPERRLQHR